MSEELLRVVAIPRLDVQIVPPQVNVADPALGSVAARPEEVQAVDAYFREDGESRTVANLMGLYLSGTLLLDLAQEHFSPPADGEADDKRPRPAHD